MPEPMTRKEINKRREKNAAVFGGGCSAWHYS